MLRNLNKFNFPYHSCKRIAKPYPNGPVDQRESFRVQLCDDFILDLANFHRRRVSFFVLWSKAQPKLQFFFNGRNTSSPYRILL